MREVGVKMRVEGGYGGCGVIGFNEVWFIGCAEVGVIDIGDMGMMMSVEVAVKMRGEM
jgi:hypothetical protein